MYVRCVYLAILLAAVSTSAHATVWYVSASAPPGGDGTSWGTAFRTIQQGANAGGEVWVAKGTYSERVTISAPVSLYGGFTGTESTLEARNVSTNPTIVDAASLGSAITISASAAGSRIDGFTINRGTGTKGSGFYAYYYYGGGIYSVADGVALLNNTISANSATFGGGIYAEGSIIQIAGNTVTGNTATFDGDNNGVMGGGIYLKGSANIVGNTVTSNMAYGKVFIIVGVGQAYYGGQGYGGGVYCTATGNTRISDNVIAANSAVGGNPGANGGGLYATANAGKLNITNNTIADNRSGYDWLYLQGESGHEDSAAVFLLGSSGTVDFANNIVAFSAKGVAINGTASANNNCLFGNTVSNYSPARTGAGDVLADPLMTGHLAGDYHIMVGSPCVDAADDSVTAPGETDVDGNPRVSGAHVDIGATEVQAGLHLAFITQPGNAAGGQPFFTQPAVCIRNDKGNILPAASASVTLSIAPGTGASGAVLSGGTTVTAFAGIAQFAGLSIDQPAVGYLLKASAPGIDPAYSALLDVAGPPNRITFTTQPENVALGSPLSPQPVVTVMDQNNVRVPNATGSVTLALTGGPTGAALSGSATVSLVQGAASFTDLSVTRGWSGYTLRATATLTSPASTLNASSALFSIYVPRVYVKADGNDTNDGTSWQQARATVQPAIAEASPDGGEVWVAGGTYIGSVTLLADRKLLGGFAGAETSAAQRDASQNVTVLRPIVSGSVVTIQPGATLSTVLDGFTISGGTGTIALPPSMPTPTYGSVSGGGIYCVDASPTITHNLITGNNMSFWDGQIGSAMYCSGSTSTPLVAFNTISANTTQKGNGTSVDLGASKAILSNNVIVNNTDGVWSGSGSVENNTIVGNGRPNSTSGNSLICDSSVRVQNNIVAFNDGTVLDYGSTFRNNDVFGNRLGNYTGTDLTGTNGNIKADPLFVGKSNGNFHLAAGSPCIDAGDSSVIPPGSVDFDGQPRIMGRAVDLGAYEFAGVQPYGAGDAATVLRASAGVSNLTATLFQRLNLADAAEGRLDILDAVAILRKAQGLDANP